MYIFYPDSFGVRACSVRRDFQLRVATRTPAEVRNSVPELPELPECLNA